MTGQQLIDLITSVLDGESPDPTYLLQLINLSRVQYENKRSWRVLVAKDTSKTVSGSNTYLTPFDCPTDFKRYLGESTLTQGMLRLYTSPNNIQYIYEVPYENILEYKDQFGYFAVDYANKKFYITGIVPGTFTIVQNYIRKTLAIALNTSWEGFDSDFHPILAFDSAARWRLGTDYDDMNQRNADDNGKLANGIFEAMSSWDAEMAISSINNIEYPTNSSNYRGSSGYGPRGARA